MMGNSPFEIFGQKFDNIKMYTLVNKLVQDQKATIFLLL